MGTDIHTIWQAKVNNKWHDVPHNYSEDRHYLLFSFLADIRNGYGFAGVPTYKPINIVADPRGYPEDFEVHGEDQHWTHFECLSPLAKECWGRWDDEMYNKEYTEQWMGEHTHSWLIAREILAMPDEKVIRSGIVAMEEYRKLSFDEAPTNYCAGISGPNVVLAEGSIDITSLTTHVRIIWEESIFEQINYFLDEVRRLATEYGADNVRIVFGFDS